MIMHNWTARHWILAAVVIGLAAGAFVLSWA
jgi:multisubunit Na+/H+ antiporter MnhC subunit